MSAPMKRVVGWFDKEEWLNVYRELFSDDRLQQKHALERVTVWKCRVSHRLSAGIECTWQLMTACLQDSNSHTTPDQDQQIRLTYAMALVRFVNHITEKEQKKSYARPIHQLAEELGLPEWLVDMRHEATHANLPSLAMLRTAAESALNWIKREYWDAQATDDCSGEDAVTPPLTAAQTEEQLGNGLVAYMQEKFHVMAEDKSSSKTLSDIRLDLDRLMSKCKQRCVRLFVQEGYMITTVEQLQAFGLTHHDLLSTDSIELPHVLVDFWRPLLQLLHQKGLLPLLLQTLAGELSGDDTITDRILAGWLATLVTANSQAGVGRLFRQTCFLDGSLLLRLCLQNPNRYTGRLLTCLHSNTDIGITKDQLELLMKLLATFTDSTDTDGNHPDAAGDSDSNKDGGSVIFTLESIKQICPDKLPVTSVYKSGTSTGWKLATDRVDWGQYPLGTCPGPPVSYTCLELTAATISPQSDSGSGLAEEHHTTATHSCTRSEEVVDEMSDPEQSQGQTYPSGDIPQRACNRSFTIEEITSPITIL